MEDFQMVYGTRLRVVQPVIKAKLTIIDGPIEAGAVELAATFGVPKGERVPLPPTATMLAIHMDQSVASDLLRQLHEAFQRMGWPLPKLSANQAAKR